MSTLPDELDPEGVERIVVWQCCAGAPDADLDSWSELVMTRVEAAGGSLVSAAGSTVVSAFDTIDLDDAVELCTALCREAKTHEPAIEVRYGLAIGNISTTTGRGSLTLRHGGAVIDRAQLLANHIEAGKVALDETAYQHAQDLFLFRQPILAAGSRGHILDLQNLRRLKCRDAVRRLGAPIVPQGARTSYEQLRDMLQASGPQRVVLRSESRHHALDWTQRLATELGAGRYLRMRQQAGGLQPLGGLQTGLRELWPSKQSLDDAGLPPETAATVAQLLAGEAVTRKQAAEMMAAVLTPTAAGRTWLMLDRLHDIDAASLGIVAEVLNRGLDGVVLLSVAPGAKVPSALTAGGASHQHALGPLSTADARELAAALLSAEPTDAVARRLATLGGRTSLGVLEAARTLVSCGDLVPDGEDFVWRTGPRSGGHAIPVDALVSERMAGLEHDAFRLLEALTVNSPGSSLELAYDVAMRDGLQPEACAPAMAKLVEEGFARSDGHLGTAETTTRNAMRNNMPPARVAELHRFAAAAVQDRRPTGPGFVDGLLAYHRSEGGHETDAGDALLSAAQATSESGFHRMAVRLAAAAMQFDPSSETKARAHALAKRLSTPPRGSSDRPGDGSDRRRTEPPGENIAERAIRSAVESIVEGEYDSVERWLDTAVVAGWDQTATRRLRAVAQMSRGDTKAAVQTLQSAHLPNASHAASARESVSWALLHIATGDTEEAITAALRALSAAGHAGDDTGRGAALHLLATCYDSLQRNDEAGRLRSAAAAV